MFDSLGKKKIRLKKDELAKIFKLSELAKVVIKKNEQKSNT